MTLKDILKITLNLTTIYVVGGIILVSVYAKTSPIIYKKAEEEKQEALKSMMPEADNIFAEKACFTQQEYTDFLNVPEFSYAKKIIEPFKRVNNGKICIDLNAIPEDKMTAIEKETLDEIKKYGWTWEPHHKHGEYYIAQKQGEVIGYIVRSFGKGYSGYIDTLVSVDTNFVVQKIEILHHTETPGLGDEIQKDYFKNRFKGKTVEQLKVVKEESDTYIEAITGATISSRAVAEDAVKNGVLLLKEKFADKG
jgi:RnfABCDGE-type electron transport complex G subunit